MDASQWDPRQWDASQWEAAAVWASIAITLLIAIVGWAYAIRAGRRVKTAIWALRRGPRPRPHCRRQD